ADERWITLNRHAVTAAFVAGLVHELNNPLQVVTGTVELLTARTDLPPDVLARLDRIAQQVNRASATVLDLVGVVRDRSPSPIRVDLRNVVERVLALRRYSLTRAGITVAYDPPAAGAAVVKARPSELAQALLNVIMNAEAALAPRTLTPPAAADKPGRAELRVSTEVRQQAVFLRVADNGPGVSPNLRDRLFEPFVSSHPPDSAAGIGLTAAAALVTRNGGRLRVEEVSEGASFVIELPLAIG
ncbi:MAG: sensor histidine kinase, partial [Vicinamibacterales bacterium]